MGRRSRTRECPRAHLVTTMREGDGRRGKLTWQKAGKQPLSSISTLQVKHTFQPLYRRGEEEKSKLP